MAEAGIPNGQMPAEYVQAADFGPSLQRDEPTFMELESAGIAPKLELDDRWRLVALIERYGVAPEACEEYAICKFVEQRTGHPANARKVRLVNLES